MRSPLPLAGLVAIGASLLCALLGDLRAWVAPIAAIWGLCVLASPRAPGPAWAWALAVRLPLLACAPTLSDDAWRYVWEGRVWAAGFNPFAHAPDAPELAHLRDAAWQAVAHKQVPTVYPPGAQALFVLLAPGGVYAWRVLSALCDVLTAHLLARRDARAGALWALLPLPALESAVSGHLEGPGVLCLVLALDAAVAADRPRRIPSGVYALLGALVKLLPGVLLLRERPARAVALAAIGVACWLPMLRLDGLHTYGTTWAYNGSVFPLVERVAGGAARPLLQVVGIAIVATAAWRTRSRAALALWASGTLVVLSPVVHPWYTLWPLAAALWPEEGRGPTRAWTLLSALMPLSYVVLSTYDPVTSRWEEPMWTRWAIYAPFYALLAYDALRQPARATSGAAG